MTAATESQLVFFKSKTGCKISTCKNEIDYLIPTHSLDAARAAVEDVIADIRKRRDA